MKIISLEDGSVLFIPALKMHTFVYYDTVDVKRTVLYISTEQLNWYFDDNFNEEIDNLFINPPYKVVKKEFF